MGFGTTSSLAKTAERVAITFAGERSRVGPRPMANTIDRSVRRRRCGLSLPLLWHWLTHTHTYTHAHPFNGALSGTTRVSRYQKGKTNVDFAEARDSELQWHQLDHMQVCTSLQTDNHASTPPLSFLLAACPSWRPTNSVKTLTANCCFTSELQRG